MKLELRYSADEVCLLHKRPIDPLLSHRLLEEPLPRRR